MADVINDGQNTEYMTDLNNQQPNLDNQTQQIPDAEAGAVVNNGQSQEFDPKTWKYSYKGKDLYPKDREHVIALMTRGHGFISEYEQLKEQKTKLDEMKGRLGYYEQLDNQLSQNPAMKQRLIEFIQNQEQGIQQNQDSNLPPEILQKIQKVDELDKWKSDFEIKQQDKALEEEISKVKSNYKNYDWASDDGNGTLEKKIINHALQNGLPSFEKAFRDYFFDDLFISSKADTLKKEQERQAQNRMAGKIVPQGGNVPQGARPAYQTNKTYNDLAQDAIKSLGG